MPEPTIDLRITLPDGPTVVCSWPWSQVPMDLRMRVVQELRFRMPDLDLNKALGSPR